VGENEDIFLGEMWKGGKSDEMDVHLYEFSCGRLELKCGLKENLNSTKYLSKSPI
jgi:hypothetical protein